MRLRSEAKKAAEPSAPPPPERPAPSSQTRASSNPKMKAALNVLVEDPTNALAEALVKRPGCTPKVPLRPLAMAPPKTPPEAPATSPFVYHSAYSGGFMTNSDGSFDHFVREPDKSHRLFGYWRFVSENDDRRAHARGFSKPEDVLVAQDRSDGSYDEIFLHWVCGSKDPNLGALLFGSAMDHLKTIYEIRHILGKPMALRGHIPMYPMSDDVRVKHYLAKKFSIEKTAKSNDPAFSSEKQTPPVNISGSSLLVQSRSDQDKSDTIQSGTRTPGNSSGHPQNTGAAPGNEYSPSLRLPTVLPLASAKAEDSGDTTSATGFRSLPSQAASSRSNYTSIYSQSRYSALRFNPAFSPPASPSEVNASMALRGQVTQPFGSFQQDTSTSSCAISSGSEYVSPYSLLLGNATQRPTYAGSAPYTPPSDSKLSSIPKSPTELQHLLSGQTQVAPLTHTVRAAPDYSPVRLAEPQLQPICGATPGDPRSFKNQPNNKAHSITSGTNKGVLDLHNQSGARERKHLEVGHQDIPSDEDTPQCVVDTDDTPLSDPTQATTETKSWFEDVPCMDCGLDNGHKSDCYISNLRPIKNLTVLDHRSLADAVERFDPGPWTTHFDQHPQQEPEDPAVQMLEMAKIIRNEDSYKNDPDFHNLPDDAMILLWALTTAPEVEVVKE